MLQNLFYMNQNILIIKIFKNYSKFHWKLKYATTDNKVDDSISTDLHT